MEEKRYCTSRYRIKRNKTRVVPVGDILVGGGHPIRIQSMVTTPTQDVEATVKQCIALAEVGCEIIRITAQNVDAAKALKEIHKKFRQAGFGNPLVADIHFLPKAAMEAVEHVEKVRVNPGNYADKKKFAIIEYTDVQYEEELQRLYEAFTPLVLRAKVLGRTLRIGTNHGSLSDRIMNRYGDTPLGMVESALEFVRIAESHGYEDIILSLKASNPKVMIQAYRLAVKMMAEEGMSYPLHLGVTEAGDGEDGRIKSAIGIGTLLADGIGDTIRVSLTEDPVYEIPIAHELAEMVHSLWNEHYSLGDDEFDTINPFEYQRREVEKIEVHSSEYVISTQSYPLVISKTFHRIRDYQAIAGEYLKSRSALGDARVEGLLLEIREERDLGYLRELESILLTPPPFYVLELASSFPVKLIASNEFSGNTSWMICKRFDLKGIDDLKQYLQVTKEKGILLAIDCEPHCILNFEKVIKESKVGHVIFTTSMPSRNYHAIGTYRALAENLKEAKINAPIWIRNTLATTIVIEAFFTSKLLEASTHSGSLFCDGIGDLISIETESDLVRSTTLAYNILQGVRVRMSKTEFVACPSCGRTLFDLETTTQRIREKTGHLKGVTIAVMGCIVNGPGEMADADFGYVGGAPGKINLYVGKACVKYHIPEEEAVEHLIDLIKEHGKWIDPQPVKNEETIIL